MGTIDESVHVITSLADAPGSDDYRTQSPESAVRLRRDESGGAGPNKKGSSLDRVGSLVVFCHSLTCLGGVAGSDTRQLSPP